MNNLSPALILHGLTAKPESFSELSEFLKSKGINAFIPHLGGHRDNLPGPEDTTFHSLELELLGYLKYLKKKPDDKIVIIAQSMGSLWALKLAAEYPEYIQKLILLSPGLLLRKKYLQYGNYFLSFLPHFITKHAGSIRKGKVIKGHSRSDEKYPITMLKHMGKLQREVVNMLPLISIPIHVYQNKGDYHLNPYSGILIKEKAVNAEVHLNLKDWGKLHSLCSLPELYPLIYSSYLDDAENV